MIKTFSALYAGHVLEGEGVGFAGTPHDDRWFPNERLILRWHPLFGQNQGRVK